MVHEDGSPGVLFIVSYVLIMTKPKEGNAICGRRSPGDWAPVLIRFFISSTEVQILTTSSICPAEVPICRQIWYPASGQLWLLGGVRRGKISQSLKAQSQICESNHSFPEKRLLKARCVCFVFLLTTWTERRMCLTSLPAGVNIKNAAEMTFHHSRNSHQPPPVAAWKTDPFNSHQPPVTRPIQDESTEIKCSLLLWPKRNH